MAVSDAKRKANAKYDSKAYDKVLLRIKKGEKDIIQAHASVHGDSFNGFVNRAIKETMQRDKEKACQE